MLVGCVFLLGFLFLLGVVGFVLGFSAGGKIAGQDRGGRKRTTGS